MPEAKKEDRRQIHIMYVYDNVVKGKLIHVFVDVAKNNKDKWETIKNEVGETKTRAYTRIKGFHAGSPGVIYSVDEALDDSGIFTNSMRLVDRWDNDEDLNRWAAVKHTAREEVARKKLLASAGDKDPIFDSLLKARKLYNALHRSKRTAFLATVIAFVTGEIGINYKVE